MTDFTKIKSRFVRERIRQTSDMKYIEGLMKIEYYISEGWHSLAEAMERKRLQSAFPEEYAAIGIELNPKHIGQIKKEQKEEEKERNEMEKLDKEERKESLRTWKKMGGK